MFSQRLALNWLPLVASLCALLTSCGSVGEPLPPLLHIPGRVEDFAVRQVASELVAEWTWPARGSEGQIFREMERFEVYSVYVPPGGSNPSADGLNDHGELVATAPALDPGDHGPGTHLVVRAALTGKFGSRFAFTVRGVSSRGKAAAWSDPRLLDVVQPPTAPANLEATISQEGVRLSWIPVDDAIRYDVERRLADGEFVSAGQPADPAFLDASPQWETPYSYRVTALKAAGESPVVPGPSSNLVELVPRDTFPPAPPTDFRALPADDGVELSWSANTEPDLQGYRVLRDGVTVHEGLLDAANYSDEPIPAGESAVYQVVAVDTFGNASSPAEVTAVSVP